MGNYRFHTPDGVIDILPQDASVKREIESNLRELFSGYGYSEVETPGIEYYDVYASENFVATEDLYKMTDMDGRIISLRYDGTIPAARLAATLMKDEKPPLRLSYIGNIENGRQSMQISTLVAISDALNVSADWLIRDLSQSTIKTANEIQRELSSCTPKEREAILKLVHLMKQSLSSLRDSQDK